MLALHNMRMVPSNVRKNKGTTECDNGTVKCKKKIKVPSNVRNVQSNVMLVLQNARMEPSDV